MRAPLLAVVPLVAACHGAPVATLPSPSLPPPPVAHVRVALDAAGPVAGNLFVTWLGADEWTALSRRGAMAPVVDMMPRAVVTPARFGAGAAPVDVALPGPLPDGAVAFAIFDTQRRFFENLFGEGVEGDAMGSAPVTGLASELHLRTVGPPRPEPDRCAGDRWQRVVVESPHVAGTIGNPTSRRLCVRLPPSYATAPARRYPVVYLLPGLMGTEDAARHAEDAPDGGPEALYVGVDTSTRAGSSYLVDGPLTGAWERFMVEGVVATVDARFRTIADARARALAGHSTGGFDAMSLAMRRPEVFGAVGASSPDALDLAHWMLGADGRASPLWLGWMRVEEAVGAPGQFASYGADWSPDPSEQRGFAWPVDLATGAVVPAVWSRWLAQSPVTWLDRPDGLARARRLAGRIYLTSGRADEARLFEPAERFARALDRVGIEHRWVPAEWGHLGHRRERWEPLLAHMLSVMTPAR